VNVHEDFGDDGTLNPAYYVVLVTDVLGQGARLRQLHQLPQTEPEIQSAIPILRDTCAFVVRWREGFKNFFEMWGSPSDQPFPSGVKEFVDRACAPNPVNYRHFSDTIIVSASLFDDGQQEQNPIMGVVGILLAASGMHLISFCVQQLTRGGVDIGIGMPLPPENDIYGPALARAVHLENTVADYPRIAVGDELLQYLAATQDQLNSKPIATPMDMVTIHAAQSCHRMLFRDTDGQLALDFLGAEVKGHFLRTDPTLFADALPKAYRFVHAEKQRWEAEGNEKLAARYATLWAYLRSRSHIWGADIDRLASTLERAEL